MAILTFERLENVASGKVAAVGGDGLLRQHTFELRNMRHHWMRSAGSFTVFTCRASGRVADARGGAFADGTLLQQYFPHGAANQRWRLEPAGPRNTFFIHADTSAFVWDVPASSTTEGTAIQLYRFNGGSNQQWRISRSEALPEVVRFASVVSGMLLDVPGFSQHDGAPLQQIPSNGGFNQMWEIIRDPQGPVTLRAVCSGKLVDYPLQAAQQSRSAAVQQYEGNGGRNQLWDLRTLRNASPATPPEVAILSSLNDFALDVPNGSKSAGQVIQAHRYHGNINQRWVQISSF